MPAAVSSLPSLPSRTRAWILIAGLAVPALGNAANLSPADMAAMMQGMQSMMRLWQGMSSDRSSGFGMPDYSPPGMMPQTPWQLPGTPPTPAMPAWPSMPGWGGPGPSAGGVLEGDWQGASGELLSIRGERVSLSAPGAGRLDGRALIHDDRLIMYIPQLDATRQFRFEVRGSYLALQDESGQVLLYQRR